ncbi:Vmc-like lipoprotein signal peptide domain-containing protein [Mycoplasma mycoides]
MKKLLTILSSIAFISFSIVVVSCKKNYNKSNFW